MRMVVAGCRNYEDYEEAKIVIAQCLALWNEEKEPVTIVSGGCRGADRLGERYASEYGLLVERCLPDWKRYKRGAGRVRNQEMARLGDCFLCFWDGKSCGTASMIEYIKKLGKPLQVHYIV